MPISMPGAHAPLEEDEITAENRLDALLAVQVDAQGQALNDHLRQHIISLSGTPSGVPVSVVEYDANEIMARARVVHNIVVRDPNEPTLTEVREMMDEVDAENESM